MVNGDMKIKLNMDRFSRQYQEAQYLLDGMVMDSMVPFMPMITGDFINRTRVESTSFSLRGKNNGRRSNWKSLRKTWSKEGSC